MSENGLVRFVRAGLANADERAAAALAPRSFAATDRYLWTSVAVQRFDRVTRRLQGWWLASHTGAAIQSAAGAWRREPWSLQYRSIAIALLAATAAHVGLTLIQGPRPGWFWMMIPATVLAFGVLLLVASRPTQSPN
jgi:hypothetical protein